MFRIDRYAVTCSSGERRQMAGGEEIEMTAAGILVHGDPAVRSPPGMSAAEIEEIGDDVVVRDEAAGEGRPTMVSSSTARSSISPASTRFRDYLPPLIVFATLWKFACRLRGSARPADARRPPPHEEDQRH